MRKVITLIMGVLCLGVNAQTIHDALRYGIQQEQGTARFQAMGGAFGALGGDLSALHVNPAGSSIFSTGQFTFTGSINHRNNDTVYGDGFSNATQNNVNINQVGGVFVFKSQDSPWKKIALGFSYDLVEDFDNTLSAVGNTTDGIDNYFLNFANGVPFENILLRENESINDAYLNIGSDQGFADQQAFLGYFGGLIDPTDLDNTSGTSYISNALYDDVNQTYIQTTNGFNTKLMVNFSGQYKENLHVGASLNFHSVFFERLTLFNEDGYQTDSPVQFTTFDNLLQTEGNGFSFTIGTIAKVNENIRVGASYLSPTWYRLVDNTSQRINSTIADNNINALDFNLINIFDDYRIKIPAKITGSAAFIFGKNGLLSFDYGYQDFSQAELRPNTDPVFAAENDFIASQLGVVNSYRFGGEYRINRISLRGGYWIEESPYADSDLIGDLKGFSAGIGYDFGNSRLDIASTRTEQDMNEFLFDSAALNNARVNRVNFNFAISYTLKF